MNLVVQFCIDAASLGGLYALLALGLGLVFGVLGLANFAHGEFVMIGAYVLFIAAGLAWPLASIAALVIVIGAALMLNVVAFRPMKDTSPATLMIASFAASFTLQNLAVMAFGARAKTVDFVPALLTQVSVGDLRISAISIVTIAVTVLLTTGCAALIGFTTLGQEIRAVSEKPLMARLVGVRTDRVVAASFAMSAALATAASLLLVAQTGTVAPSMGSQLAAIGFIATVIGGVGSLVGCALGGFLVGALTVLLQLTLPADVQPFRDAFVFGGVIAVLLLRPQGLVSSSWRRERV